VKTWNSLGFRAGPHPRPFARAATRRRQPVRKRGGQGGSPARYCGKLGRRHRLCVRRPHTLRCATCTGCNRSTRCRRASAGGDAATGTRCVAAPTLLGCTAPLRCALVLEGHGTRSRHEVRHGAHKGTPLHGQAGCAKCRGDAATWLPSRLCGSISSRHKRQRPILRSLYPLARRTLAV
jgi:hypothetical protein